MNCSTISQLRRLSPADDFHYFFGYYDVPAYNQAGDLHLAHRVNFRDRLPLESDVAEVGLLDRASNSFRPLATTTAWNFQQGSMLQWMPHSPTDEVIFNVMHDGNPGCCILEPQTGTRRYFSHPVANVEPQGRYSLSINFGRLFDFRPGYGYAGYADPRQQQGHPASDGIYLQDFRDGSAKLILSLQELWDFSRQWLEAGQEKLIVNHLTFNPSGTRFLALVRYFTPPGVQRKTLVITASTDGSDLQAVKPGYIIASHYHWKDDETLMIYAAGKQGLQLYGWNVLTGEESVFDTFLFSSDGHCSYSPDRKFVLYDSYPDAERYQRLFIYDLSMRTPIHLGQLYSYPVEEDIRCDLHPRWNRKGDAISLDSNHEGSRQIYELEL